jgi:hypothetical protein
MIAYYDRAGQRIRFRQWARMIENPEAKRVAVDTLDNGVYVSTVWLGLDHRFLGTGPPLIFETMVFLPTDDGYGGPVTADSVRYSTEADAAAGHARTVQLWALWSEDLEPPSLSYPQA